MIYQLKLSPRQFGLDKREAFGITVQKTWSAYDANFPEGDEAEDQGEPYFSR